MITLAWGGWSAKGRDGGVTIFKQLFFRIFFSAHIRLSYLEKVQHILGAKLSQV